MPDPQPVIEQIACLEGARPRSRLGQGPTSDSWLLDSSMGRLVLRIDRPLATSLGLDRAAETALMQQARGLAAEVVFSAPERGWLVTRFVEGAVWTPDELVTTRGIDTLAETLRDLHVAEVSGKRFDPGAIAARYAKAVDSPEATRRAQEAADLAADLYGPASMTLCHHDAHAGNLVGRKPVLLDWEYAALGEPLMDLAVVARYHDWTNSQALALLEAWSGGAEAAEIKRLDTFCQLYDHIAGLWQMVVSG